VDEIYTVILLDSDDANDVPDALLAFTVNVYSVPVATPVIVIGLVVDEP
jgi:hypothetical protein